MSSDHGWDRTPACQELGAIILAGGKGKRLVPDKGCLRVGGRPIVARVADVARQVCQRVVVVGQAPLPQGLGLRTFGDALPGGGPLQALGVGLRALGTSWAALLAWDMPFVSAELLRHMTCFAQDCDAVVPRVGQRVQPLCALYSRSCELVIASMDGGRDRAMAALLNRLRVRWVAEEEIRRFGDPNRLFLSVNTPADLEQAQALAAAEDKWGKG